MTDNDTMDAFHHDVLDAVKKAERNGADIISVIGGLQVVIHCLIAGSIRFDHGEEAS